ncbi:MAG: hypothetical protein LQ345_002052 [Seirophora villosa]|nr:MAG: hypothetical protein LQ345_002052 [Seirophora villosa]
MHDPTLDGHDAGLASPILPQFCATDASPHQHTTPDGPPSQTAAFFRLPVELRNAIYRLLVLAPLSETTTSRLYRPRCVDHVVFNVGYFKRDGLLPLLRTCHQIHTEASSVLYSENLFVFHFSSIAHAPLPFFASLPTRYLRLMKKAYLFTEYFLPWPMQPSSQLDLDPATVDEVDRLRSLERRRTILNIELEGSKMVARKALPASTGFSVNFHETIEMAAPDMQSRLQNARLEADKGSWWSTSHQLWKMVMIESADSTCRQEFRRVVWSDTSSSSARSEGEVAPHKTALSLTATVLHESPPR